MSGRTVKDLSVAVKESLLNRHRFILEYGVTTQIKVEDNREMTQELH